MPSCGGLQRPIGKILVPEQAHKRWVFYWLTIGYYKSQYSVQRNKFMNKNWCNHQRSVWVFNCCKMGILNQSINHHHQNRTVLLWLCETLKKYIWKHPAFVRIDNGCKSQTRLVVSYMNLTQNLKNLLRIGLRLNNLYVFNSKFEDYLKLDWDRVT